MENSFFSYIERLQIMGFFVAYPLIYFLVKSIIGTVKNETLKQIPSLLPYSYALVGTLYLGLQITDLYPDFSMAHIYSTTQLPYLKIWCLLSILFWLPFLARKTYISLLHSLIIFFLLVKDLFYQLTNTTADKNIVKNDMRLFTDSLLLNVGALLLLIIISLLFIKFKRTKKPT